MCDMAFPHENRHGQTSVAPRRAPFHCKVQTACWATCRSAWGGGRHQRAVWETGQRKPTETPAGPAIRTAVHIYRGLMFCLLLSNYVLSCVTLLGSCHFLCDKFGCLKYTAKDHTVHTGIPHFTALPRCCIFTN